MRPVRDSSTGSRRLSGLQSSAAWCVPVGDEGLPVPRCCGLSISGSHRPTRCLSRDCRRSRTRCFWTLERTGRGRSTVWWGPLFTTPGGDHLGWSLPFLPSSLRWRWASPASGHRRRISPPAAVGLAVRTFRLGATASTRGPFAAPPLPNCLPVERSLSDRVAGRGCAALGRYAEGSITGIALSTTVMATGATVSVHGGGPPACGDPAPPEHVPPPPVSPPSGSERTPCRRASTGGRCLRPHDTVRRSPCRAATAPSIAGRGTSMPMAARGSLRP